MQNPNLGGRSERTSQESIDQPEERISSNEEALPDEKNFILAQSFMLLET